MSDTPPCPDPLLWVFTAYKHDRRTKTGWRLVDEWEAAFPDDDSALAHGIQEQDRTGHRIEHRKKWVLRTGWTSRLPYWEEWNTPHHCSPSSELYWSM